MALKPGDTLFNGQYRILSSLGRGGFGFVYEAQDTLLEEKVAIKELIPALVGDEVMLRRFLAEAKSTMRLTHKRIVRTHAVFQEGDHYYLVMEHMPGGSLEQRLRDRGPLPVAEAVRIAAEVCEGLACAHEEGVVHCDLKPANILFDKRGEAKVADFGIAHISEQILSRSWQTPSGFVAGTLPYMSPEQVDGVRDDPRLDVYALGAVLYRMLTGRTYLDFDERETPGAQAQNVLRIQNQTPEPPSAHNRRVPPWLDRIVLKALDKRPRERYATAADLHAALVQRAAATLIPPPQVPQPVVGGKQPTPRPRPARFWPIVIGGAGLVLFLVIALLVAVGGSKDGDQTTGPADRTAPAALVATERPASPTYLPTPSVTPVPTRRPVSSPASADTAKPSPSITPVPPVSPQPTRKPVVPIAAPTPSIACDPAKANAEVYAEIVYPQHETTIKTDAAIDIIGTATGSNFTRYTYTVGYYWCPEIGNRSGCSWVEGWSGESYEPVRCGLLYRLDTSALHGRPGGGFRVYFMLRAVKPDSNYHQTLVEFYVER